MKKWEVLSKSKFQTSNFDFEKLIKILLLNRGIKSKKEIENFLNPKLENVTAKSLGIDVKQLVKAVKRVKTAISEKEMIVVFGDYDVDGITGTAIIWETLTSLTPKVMPYIPHRIDEGYGLSLKGIENVKKKYPNVSLIITVDNGIVANQAVKFAHSLGIDVIITDHHVPSRDLPKAYCIVHSTKVCGAAVGYIFSQGFSKNENDHLGLVALATVADMMKLTDFNRTLLIFGLKVLHKTKRPGILALVKSSAIEQDKIGVYEVGHILGPRINAMGRLEHAMESLRLLCTNDKTRAGELAKKLTSTNLERQQITFESFEHAKNLVGKNTKKLLFISDETYEPGVIGLIAGRLVEEYYRPAIVASIGETYSKASARSVAGFNIIEFIRLSSHLLIDAGGHPGAAGFTVETKKLSVLQNYLEKLAEKQILPGLLTRKVRIDCHLDLDLIGEQMFNHVNELSPFGYGNPEPTFLAKNVTVQNIQIVGLDKKHLKLFLRGENKSFSAIFFNFDADLDLHVGDRVDAVYAISENEWNGNKKLELKIKDLKKVSSPN